MLGYAISWPSNIKIQRADVKCVSAFEETSAADLERWVAFKNCCELRKAYSCLKSGPSLESLSCRR